MTETELRERLLMLVPQSDTRAIIDAWRALTSENKRLLDDLREIHVYQCGCDLPGKPLTCTGPLGHAFGSLALFDG